MNPTLTTINTPLYDAGAIACERLIDRIHGSKEPVGEQLATHLVLRQSTAINRQANGLG
ncbi:substrate-binding domain-containing protein [Phycisphaeraceae bacterium D3-23]